MLLYSLDVIVRSSLLRKGYPIHFYMQFLKYAMDAHREFTFDTMQNIRSIKLPLNEYNAIPLPVDFVDWVKVGLANGQSVRPLAQGDGYNRLNNYDDAGNPALYATPSTIAENALPMYEEAINLNGEAVGRQFGYMGGNNPNTFKVLRERNGGEIQFDISASGDIILDYISDGLSADADSQIHPYAAAAIEAYINWQMKENSRAYNMGEKEQAKQLYDYEYRTLRGRLMSFTLTDLRRVLHQNYSGTIKN